MVLTASDGDRDLVYYDIIDQSVPGALSVHPTTGRYVSHCLLYRLDMCKKLGSESNGSHKKEHHCSRGFETSA